MLVCGEKDVRRALDFTQCLEINRKAFISLSDGTAIVPNRLGLTYPNQHVILNPSTTSSETTAATSPQDWTLIKPAAYYGKSATTDNENENHNIKMGLKVVSVRANNPSRYGLPLVPATILLVDPATGVVDATISGTYLTVVRTSAGPALAAQVFQPNAQHLVLFGAGAQAECHIQLIQWALHIKHGRTIPRITIVNRTRGRAEELRQKILLDPENAYFSRDTTMEVLLLEDTTAVTKVLEMADMVATTTNSQSPLWSDNVRLSPGCLITGIGSYTPDMSEVPPGTVNRCHVLVDTPEALRVGDLKHLGVEPSELNNETTRTTTQQNHPITLFGSALANPQSVAVPQASSVVSSGVDCIFFKSVGTAIQDVLTAELVIQRARSLGIGQLVDMS